MPIAYRKLPASAFRQSDQLCELPVGADSGGSDLPDTGHSPPSAVSSRYAPAAEGRGRKCDLGFCQFHPGFRAYGQTARRGKLCRQPPHSHTIVSGTYKYLKENDFVSPCAKLTVKSAVSNSRLGAIDADRYRKDQVLRQPRTRSRRQLAPAHGSVRSP